MNEEEVKNQFEKYYEFNKETSERLKQQCLIDEEQFEKCIRFMQENNIYLFNHIGTSDYSQTFIAYSAVSQRYVSVKIVQSFRKNILDNIIKPLTNDNQQKIIQDYIISFEKIKNILSIQLIVYSDELESMFFVQELGINTLQTYLNVRRQLKLPLNKKEVYMICYQLFIGLREVHENYKDVLLERLDLTKILITPSGDELKYGKSNQNNGNSINQVNLNYLKDYERYSNQLFKAKRNEKNVTSSF